MKKLKYLALTLGTCAVALGGSYQAAHAESSFTPEQKAEIEVMFKEFLANNPRDILESVDNYRAEQERQQEQSAQENLSEYKDYFAGDNMPIAGNPEGDITIVEFFDYNCGYCKKAFEDVRTILKEDPNVRVVFQEMPILSPSSKKMAEYALAAKMQGKYFEMHTALMDYRGVQNDAAFINLATNLGLDVEKLKTDAASQAVASEIAKSLDAGRALGIRGTPGFVVGNKIFPGYIGTDNLRNAVKDARLEAAGK